MSRRIFIRTLLACCIALVTWFNFAPNAVALGGKLPTINKLAPEFTLPPNTGGAKFLLLIFAVMGCTLLLSQGF